VSRTATRRVADEQALVLVAEGLAPTVHRVAGAWVVSLPETQAERGRALLALHARESRERRSTRRPARGWRGRAPATLGLAFAGALVAFHLVTGPVDAGSAWFAVGMANAEALRAGELERAWTALTLHADAAHLLGNALAGGLLLALLAAALGPGLALFVLVTAGAAGNLANAWLRSTSHLSLGASTAVFGAVGALGGLAAARGRRRLGRRAPGIALAACLGILAMIGTGGERTDVWAHAFGVAAGLALGAGLGRVLAAPPGAALQLAAGLVALLSLAASWAAALRHLP
jgi:membrane associated rhomboid family serine protease